MSATTCYSAREQVEIIEGDALVAHAPRADEEMTVGSRLRLCVNHMNNMAAMGAIACLSPDARGDFTALQMSILRAASQADQLHQKYCFATTMLEWTEEELRRWRVYAVWLIGLFSAASVALGMWVMRA